MSRRSHGQITCYHARQIATVDDVDTNTACREIHEGARYLHILRRTMQTRSGRRLFLWRDIATPERNFWGRFGEFHVVACLKTRGLLARAACQKGCPCSVVFGAESHRSEEMTALDTLEALFRGRA
jgi:hypothetical protein